MAQLCSLPAEPPRKPKNTGVSSLSLLQWIFPTQKLNQGLRRLQTWRQGIWLVAIFYIFLRHVSKWWNLITPHSVSPPSKTKFHLRQGSHHFFYPLKSLLGGGWGGISVVLYFLNSICLWAAWFPRRLTIVGIRLSVTFKSLGIHHHTCALHLISKTLFQWCRRCQVLLEPLRTVKSIWKDFHVHGFVMDGHQQIFWGNTI